jgi:hypothetical protein
MNQYTEDEQKRNIPAISENVFTLSLMFTASIFGIGISSIFQEFAVSYLVA